MEKKESGLWKKKWIHGICSSPNLEMINPPPEIKIILDDQKWLSTQNDEPTLKDRYDKSTYIFSTLEKNQILSQRHNLVSELNIYIYNRNAEKGLNAFFRNLNRFDCKVKTGAAQKLIDFLNGNKEILFEEIEIEALIETNSVLGGIVSKYKNTQFPLPKAITNTRFITWYTPFCCWTS
ncbi:MAG: hypothetical protein H0T84_13615 [Tatlockia sp.]|nr:hypothetical protein [Tatlockia sp.]